MFGFLSCLHGSELEYKLQKNSYNNKLALFGLFYQPKSTKSQPIDFIELLKSQQKKGYNS